MLQGLLRPAAAAAAAGRHCRIGLPLPLPLWAPRSLASLRQDAAVHTNAHSNFAPASETVRSPGLQFIGFRLWRAAGAGQAGKATEHASWGQKRSCKAHRSWSARATMMTPALMEKLEWVQRLVSESPVTLFTKTYCPYSRKAFDQPYTSVAQVKELMAELGVNATIVDLDVRPDGDLIQAALTAAYDQSTVPYVFVGGKLIGGCDVVLALHESGQLKPLLQAVGALPQDQTA
eukprot:SM000042S15313  [mRNA]  locus=s42:203483:204649:- [translate_table: standard]